MKKQDFQCEHLKELPLGAIVAFAVRCARRVQNLAELPEGHPSRDRLREDVEAALSMAEEVARGSTASSPDLVVEALDASRRVADVPLRAETALAAASEAAHAAATACHLSGSPHGSSSRITADVAALNAFTAAVDAYETVGLNNNDFVRTALADYERLVRLELGSYPEAGKPIDPSPSGPLGPF